MPMAAAARGSERFRHTTLGMFLHESYNRKITGDFTTGMCTSHGVSDREYSTPRTASLFDFFYEKFLFGPMII